MKRVRNFLSTMWRKNSLSPQWFYPLSWLFLVIFYFFSRLYQLLILPVFADEAIYIYWAQLALSDWGRYSFYPLNDGKTPLFIWLLIPMLKIFTQPLLAGRLLSVFFGLAQLFLQIKLAAFFMSKKKYQLLAGLLLLVLPGFIFNQRLSLMDSALTFFLTLSFYFTLKAGKQLTNAPKENIWMKDAILAGVCLALSLWTKFSALIFLPVLLTSWWFFIPLKKDFFRQLFKQQLPLAIHWLMLLCLTVAIGMLGFYSLKISPSFSQIFVRGGDFLYSGREFLASPLAILTRNAMFAAQVLSNYAGGLFLFLTCFISLLLVKKNSQPLLLLLSGLLLLAPIVILGKQIYSRYFLPVLPFLILSFTLGLSHLNMSRYVKVFLVTVISAMGIIFNLTAVTKPEQLPLLPADQGQYLTQWSAGYGIVEVLSLLEQQFSYQNTLVLTEGHIGTLPDGLQIYLAAHPQRNYWRVEGVGQPVRLGNLQKFANLIAQYPRVILVVNSDRLAIDNLLADQLLATYKRPLPQTASLQVWQLK